MNRLRKERAGLLAGSARVPLLSVDRLRVRGGGRVLVDDLEFDLDEGAMVALVGPPGATASAVLDCISGSRRPARGSVRLRGRRLERDFTPGVACRIAAIGLMAGLVFAAAAVDADRLWSAVVSRGIAIGEPLTPGTFARRLRSCFRAELAIGGVVLTPPGEEWRVVTADGREILARRAARAEAVAIRNALQAAVTARRAGPGTVPDASDMATVEEDASKLPEQVLDRLAAGKRLIRRRGWMGLGVGWLVGVILAAADWRWGSRGPDVAARAGLARVFPGGRPFPGLTVRENVLVACDRAAAHGVSETACAPVASHDAARRSRTLGIRHGFGDVRPAGFPHPALGGRRGSPAARQRTAAELAFVGLADADGLAGRLAGHARIRLDIARALATDAALLLLDDPAAGCRDEEIAELAHLIARVRERGIAILLAAAEEGPLARLADRVIPLDRGRREERSAAGNPPRAL